MKDDRNEAYMLFLHLGTCILAALLLLFTVAFLTGCGRREIVVERLSGGTESAQETDLRAEKVSEAGEDAKAAAEADLKADPFIYVHVCGAVRTPGVYELPEGSRIYQAVETAGGFEENADQEWCNQAQELHDGDSLKIYTRKETKALRKQGKTPSSDCFGITASVSSDRILAGTLAAGAQVSSTGKIVSNGGNTDPDGDISLNSGSTDSAGTVSLNGASADQAGKIDLNSADADQLMTIPGIGQTRAQDILSYRRTHGRFESTEELMQISGIGTGLYEKIKEYVTVL